MSTRRKQKSNSKYMYGVKPINSIAAKVLGVEKAEKRDAISIEIRSLRRMLKKNIPGEERKKAERQIKKLTAQLETIGQPSDKSLVGERAIEKAQKEMEKAQWERENSRR